MKRVMYSRISLWRWVRGCINVLAPCRVGTNGLASRRRKRGCTPEMACAIVCARRAKRQEEGCRPYKKGRAEVRPSAEKIAAPAKACRFAHSVRTRAHKLI